eukprot:CAMPEP_0184870672 /NCGR_PEP_ID=MMETSP0580-20130426/38407_1 /TAXON_ID=1118495 /ORGANISM="Dactyliosolen fragilissimus" /LENGTH=50 /DNA_ID=CAMNT_0027372895 /DNA_START=635 /DNA_END=784 /DNA_ORIENTATION=-
MSMMTDSLEECAKVSAASFAGLVQVAPLVSKDKIGHFEIKKYISEEMLWG